MTEARGLLAYLQEHQTAMTTLLAELVEMESPSDDKGPLDRLARALSGRLEALGAAVQILPQAQAGDHVCARWGEGEGGTLLLCHMDTVCDVGTLARRPARVEGGRLYGPGSLDMKGGITNALWAIGALRELDLFPARPLTLLLTSDEETGSRTSRAPIEAEARRQSAVLVLEPAQPPDGALKTWRKGTGAYLVTATGRAAHAGVDHAKGVNAIEELAHQVLALQRLTDYEAGTTVNVGIVSGGKRSNVVPQQAWARVDVRVMDEGQAAQLDGRIRSLRPRLEGASLEISGGVGRPPMVRTPAVAALFAQAAALAAEMGFEVTEAGSGGGSDGNFTAALGIPTLDGLGPAGDGAHAEHEHVVLSSLPERSALLAALVLTLGAG